MPWSGSDTHRFHSFPLVSHMTHSICKGLGMQFLAGHLLPSCNSYHEGADKTFWWTVNCLFHRRPQGFIAEIFTALLCEVFLVPVFDEWLFSWLPRAVESECNCRHPFPCCVCLATHCLTAGNLITQEHFFPRYKNIKIYLLNSFQSNGGKLLIKNYAQILRVNTRENANIKDGLKIHTS